jgi:phage shock protein PspC (stress-responsive transcriptional regulator)
MQKRLYRSKTNRVVAGVCGGIGEYLDIDPILVRIAWILFCFMGGAGILAYFISMVIIPENPQEKAPEVKKRKDEAQAALIGGVILLLIGSFFLLSNFGFLSWVNWLTFWSVLIIAIGLILVFKGRCCGVNRWQM